MCRVECDAVPMEEELDDELSLSPNYWWSRNPETIKQFRRKGVLRLINVHFYVDVGRFGMYTSDAVTLVC